MRPMNAAAVPCAYAAEQEVEERLSDLLREHAERQASHSQASSSSSSIPTFYQPVRSGRTARQQRHIIGQNDAHASSTLLGPDAWVL